MAGKLTGAHPVRVPRPFLERVKEYRVEPRPVDEAAWMPGKATKRTHAAVTLEARQRERSLKGVAQRARSREIQQWAEPDAATVVEQIARGALYDPRDFYETEDGPLDDDGVPRWRVGDLKPMHRLTEAQAQAIVGVEVVMKNAVAGDGKIDRVLKYRFAPREKYVELAARYHGLLLDRTESNVNVTVVGSKLDAARARLATVVAQAKALPEPPDA